MDSNETTSLRYIADRPLYTTEKPYALFYPVPGVPANNIIFETGPEQVISDVRGRENDFSLARNGFAFVNLAEKGIDIPEDLDWGDSIDVEERYVPCVKKIVGELLSLQELEAVAPGDPVERFPMWEWKQRRASSTETHKSKDEATGAVVQLGPAYMVHIDMSPCGVVDWMRNGLGEEKANALINKYRVRVINIWRPLLPHDTPVEDVALALCDSQSIEPWPAKNHIEVTNVLPEYNRRNIYVTYSKDMKFYYKSGMTREDVCAFVVFDSQQEGGWVPCPHTAFKLSKYSTGEIEPVKPRESIEMRIVVLS